MTRGQTGSPKKGPRQDGKEDAKTVVASNRKARYDYDILEVVEAGLCLSGPEVKSLRGGKAVLEGSFGRVENDEVFLYNLHIAPYSFNTLETVHEPARTRKLLMRRREISRLGGKLTLKGLSLIPLELYFKHGWAKVALALAKGKRGPDKRDSIKKRDLSRDMEREFRGKFKL